MHQTFYIDIDEEITSIVDRIKKARVGEVILVVPKRALLIQSIVNLRLLKKEADSLNLSLMVVTQDKLGKLLIEKAGILVQQKLEDVSGEEIVRLESVDRNDQENIQALGQEAIRKPQSQNRLDKIGSESYFDEPLSDTSSRIPEIRPKRTISKETPDSVEKITNVELAVGTGQDKKKMDMSRISMPRRSEDVRFSAPMDSPKDKKIQDFFFHAGQDDREKIQKIEEAPLSAEHLSSEGGSGKMKKVLISLGFIFFLAVSGAAAFIFIPKASIDIALKGQTKSGEFEIKADTKASAIDYENDLIPAKLISEEAEIKKTFEASSKKNVSSQKAKGTVTLYNEFSSSSQSLVATTRLLTPDGKLFRLTKGVTIPGTTKVGDETKPGAIETEVVADEAGAQYNIEPTTFTIPGFKDSGSGKYEKIYAKSTKSMTGGGDSGGSNGQAKAISESDITDAKAKILPEIIEAAKQKIKDASGNEYVLLDGTADLSEATYKLSNSAGEVASSFEITAKTTARAIVFKENDLKRVLANTLARTGDGKINLESNDIVFEYGKATSDFSAGEAQISVSATGKISPNIDLDKMKKEIAGKSNDVLETYLSNFPDIEKAEVNYWPPFLNSRLPFYKNRIEIIIRE